MGMMAGMRSSPILLAVTCLFGLTGGWAQGTRANYERAAKLEEFARSKVTGGKIHPQWFRHNASFWYRDEGLDGRGTFFAVEVATGRKALAFDHARLAEALTKVAGKPVDADRLPFRTLHFGENDRWLSFDVGSTRWQLDLATYELRADSDADMSDDEADALPGSLRIRSTERTGDATVLTVVNRTPDPVRVEWVNFDGRRLPYGTIAPGKREVEHTYAGHVWLIADPQDKPLAVFEATEDDAIAVVDAAHLPKPEPKPPTPAHTGTESPDKRWWAFVRERNIYLFDTRTGKETALTHDGQPRNEYEDDFTWSPDSQRLVAKRTQAAQEHKVYFIESSPADQLQPKLLSEDYLKPGDCIAHPRLHLFRIPEGTEIPVSDALCPNPWDLDEFHWSPDSRLFTFTYNQRGHQVMRIIGVDAETGATRAVLNEETRTFIDYSGKHYLKYLDGSGEFIWMSERDGWNHLYLYDAKTGALKNQITRGPWVVREVDRVDEKTRQIWFRAGGIKPGQNPYYVQCCRVNFDGTGLTVLTDGDGDHQVKYAPDGQMFFDIWSRVNQPPVTQLRRAADGKLLCELSRGDWSELLKTGWSAPEPFVAKGRDGTTDIWGVIFRPTHFDPARKYPVIEDIYAGPQSSYAPRSFQPFYGTQKLAELGFIVVQIDGMGTSDRSKAFHDVCWQNLQDAGLPDRILWMQAAAKKYPCMNLNRVGIYGVSAGGQSALGALLFHGDFYQVGWADCGCHDNRMDKIWWNEQWMGWPVGPQYAAASNVTHAAQLTGKLMLVVGELDHNVDPSSTMQVVNALIKADKDFDLLVVPGADHGAGGSPYGQRRMDDFFVRNLWGVEPREK